MGASSQSTGIFDRLREIALRSTLLPLGDRLLRQRMIKRLAFLERAQWWDRERLHEERDRLLQELISTSYHEVPLYRQLMDENRVKPSDVRTASDLPKLPIVTKDILRDAYPTRATRNTGQRTYESCSSGSTGRPFCVLEDSQTAGWYRASFLLAVAWSGWRIGERYLQMGITPKRSGIRGLKDRVLRCSYASAYDLRDAALDAHLRSLEERRIRYVWGYPSAVFFLARRALEQGWNVPLQAVVTWGDALFDEYRRTIEQAFRCMIYDTYGCGEGIQIAAQCGNEDAYHIHVLDAVVEFVSEDGLDPFTDACPIVVTRLHAGPMPLIRYRLGDLATDSPPGCSCGRGFDRLASIGGRETDVVTTPSGNRLIVHFFTGILEHFPQIDTFQVVQDAADSITLRIVARSGYTAGTNEKVIARLKEMGADLDIQTDVVDEIPVTAGGKRRFVINNVSTSVGSR